MNILFVLPYTPTPIRSRPYNLLQTLLRRGHSVTLATVWENRAERDQLALWQQAGARLLAAPLGKTRRAWNLLRGLPGGRPLQAGYSWQPALAQSLAAAAQDKACPYDIIHVEHLRGARYGLWLAANCRQGDRPAPIVWDSVDCISYLFDQAAHHSRSLPGRLMARADLERTRRYEAWLTTQFARVLVTSRVDKTFMDLLSASYAPGKAVESESPCQVLSNGVDLSYFTPSDLPREADRLVFTGKMSYHANATAALYLARSVMPRIWAHRPQTTLSIVGQKPGREVQALARDPRIRVTGYVADIRPHLQSASVAVAPMVYGAGVQNKVLEAMACATPVVATVQAAAALETVDERDVLLGADADGLAQGVLTLLSDCEKRRRLGAAGRAYVTMHHDWRSIVERLEEIYQEVRA